MGHDTSKLKPYIKGNLPKIDESPLTFLSTELGSIAATLRQVIDALRGVDTALTAQESAWTAYTPVVTAGAGAFTAVSATGRFRAVGKTVFVAINITITTNGTAASDVIATLPSAAFGSAVFAGRENTTTGKLLQGVVGGSSVVIFNYDNTYPGGTGYALSLSGTYETV